MTTQDNSIGLYLHVPFCKHACPYCDFYKVELRDYPARQRLDFPGRLLRECHLLRDSLPTLSSKRLETIYFGGGTPSTLVPEAVGELIVALKDSFPIADEVEVTLEANPENLTLSRCRQWKAAGINRLSIGVQSFHSRDLKLLERLHEQDSIYTAIANARDAGIDNFSIDLMFALPDQTLVEWIDNLERALSLRPNHLSFYGLTYHEETPFFQWLKSKKLSEADEDLQVAMYRQGSELLRAAGYEHYEISNFALPGKRSRHNQRYWRGLDVLGLGPGAHSNYAKGRWMNPEDLEAWQRLVDEGQPPRIDIAEINEEVERSERLYRLLRTTTGIHKEQDPDLFASAIAWAKDAKGEWYRLDEERFYLTIEGWLLADAITEAILG